MTNHQALTIPTNLSGGAGLAAYIQAANEAPIVTADEEKALARRYHEHGDLDAARELVMSHLRHVIRVARGYMGYGLPLADLIQEGNIGLMKAVKRFDPERDIRLVSFAVHWIRAEIYDFVLRNWRIVKVATTKSQRKLFFNLRKSRNRLGWMNNGEVHELADDLHVSAHDVREMESRLSGIDVPFDGADDNDDSPVLAPSNYLADNRYAPDRILDHEDSTDTQRDQVAHALDALDPRSKDIIQRRWLNEDQKTTLHELAGEYGVSAERIRQIESRALAKMKTSLAA
ncbi:MAG: RNA polymerase sigma factor RpoH [Gammaproteobacteria bacterium]|nr:RNA polymerase sigma factor RpoH [Gammaproteobacteria bacterium]MDH3467718.1 RNA polymerase sigma factor RpoH [Gammaproteobacteria bacterium]